MVIQGTWPGEGAQEHQSQVAHILKKRTGQITLFPAFSSNPPEGATIEISTLEITSGEASKAALEVLTSAARTLHPTHSWMATGRSAPMHIPGNLYAMTPSGMGSPLGEVTNFSGVELLIGVPLECLTVIEAAEETAKVPYGLLPAPVQCTIIDQSGKPKSSSFVLRDPSPVARNIDKLGEMLLAEDALIQEPWGFVIHTRVALDRLCSQLRSDPEWLLK